MKKFSFLLFLILFCLFQNHLIQYHNYFFCFVSILLLITLITSFFKLYYSSKSAEQVQLIVKILFSILIFLNTKLNLLINNQFIISINSSFFLACCIILLCLNIIILLPKNKGANG